MSDLGYEEGDRGDPLVWILCGGGRTAKLDMRDYRYGVGKDGKFSNKGGIWGAKNDGLYILSFCHLL